MNINELLKGVGCECGRHHSCDIDYVYIEKGAILRLGELCKNYKSILIVADENTFNAAGKQVLSALSGKKTNQVVFGGKTVLIPNEKTVAAVEDALNDADLIIGIGSGVIQDTCKYVSFEKKIPYFIVATAPSMDGYASTGAAMIMGGMKVTYSTGLPSAIIADTEVLKNAPMEMIKAGYGDIIGKFSALGDWELSREVNGEYFCPYVYNLTYEMIEKTLSLADGLLKRDEKAVAVLMEALVTVGIAMSFAGTSRPASGSEHHLSHFFEITGIVNGENYFPHGIDVAYSTVVTAGICEKIRNSQFLSPPYIMNRKEYEAEMQRVYKTVSEGCIALQDKMGRYGENRIPVYQEKEAEIRKILEKMPSPAEIIKMLESAGLDINEFYKLYGEAKIKDAIKYAKDLKDRYTVLWMNYDLFEGEHHE